MANTTTKSKEKASTVKEKVIKEPVENAAEEAIVPKEIDLNQLIPVYNGFDGKLAYKSTRTNEWFRWSELGAEQEIELRELKSAKNSKKAFFENNWFMFDDEHRWVISYLGVEKYYKYAINIDEFDAIFEKSPAEITKIIGTLSNGQKQSLAYRARQFVLDGTIDSRKVITTLENSLGVELIEK